MRAGLAKTLLYCFALLPLPITHRIASISAQIGWLYNGRLKGNTLTNLNLCFPQLTQQQRNQLGRQSFIENSKTLAELGAMWMWNQQRALKLVNKVSGGEYLNAALQRGHGVILALPHLGAWELIGVYCSSQHAMTSLYRPPKLQPLDTFIQSARERFGANLVPTNVTGVKKIIRALKDNHIVAILPDQDPAEEGGVFAPFFGVNTHTMTLLPRLADKTQATVLFAYAERLPHSGFHIHFLPASDQISSKDLLLAATSMNTGIETCVRALPAQYQWNYRRFKKRPPGEPKIYK